MFQEVFSFSHVPSLARREQPVLGDVLMPGVRLRASLACVRGQRQPLLNRGTAVLLRHAFHEGRG